MISEQNIRIDKTRREYYCYLNVIYEEITEFLREEDGAVNAQKLEMMFEKTASPLVYWLKENMGIAGYRYESGERAFVRDVK